MAVSLLTWLIFFGLTRGIRQAAFLNLVTTVAKILPILAFVLLTAFLGFSWDRFTMDFWSPSSNVSVIEQVKGFMVFTVWAFIGVEGASVYSKQARTRRDVGRATVIGFTTVLVLLVTVATLSYGALSQEELAGLPDNSMASVLEAVVGPWGGAFISIGLCLSVLGLLPQQLGRTNKAGAPFYAQLVSTIVIQILVIVFFLNETTYNSMVQLATMMYMLPYFFTSFYLLLLTIRGRGIAHPGAGTHFDDSGPEVSSQVNRRHGAVAAIATIYSLWLFYAADVTYLLFGALLVIPGMVPYVWTRLRTGNRIFNSFEWCVVALVALGGACAIYGLSTGVLSLS